MMPGCPDSCELFFNQVDVFERQFATELGERDAPGEELPHLPTATGQPPMVPNRASRLVDEEQVLEGGDLLVVLPLGAAVIVTRRGRQNLEQQHGIQQAHAILVNLPLAAGQAAVGVGVESGVGNVDPLVAIEGPATAA